MIPQQIESEFPKKVASNTTQFSIRAILESTLAVACWFGLFHSFPGIALLLSGVFAVIALSVVLRRMRLMFWLPLGFSMSWVLTAFAPAAFWFSESVAIIGLGLSCLISIHVFTLRKTMQVYRHRDNCDQVLITGIGYSVLGGCYCGLMIALPVVLSLSLPVFNVVQPRPDSLVHVALAAAFCLIIFPLLGSFAGFIIGLYLGFVCDVCVALQFGKRR